MSAVKVISATKAITTTARRVGRFELLRVLGTGAQATVWLAHDPRLDRDVALKLLNPAADPQSLSEWLNEARAVSRLAHPNVVPVFEADEAAGQPYLVFELVDGPTLQQARRTRPAWPAREAVSLMLGVLDALAAAHEQGIVHRDLKPSNVLLGTDGRPRVMDFGIAARVVARPSDTTLLGVPMGPILGTPGYISPEAARGEPPVPAMDVFSAGVMLAELLIGASLLLETDPMRAVQRVQDEDMVLPESVQIDDTLRGVVLRAVARQTRARYDGARSLHAALSAWLNPEGTEAPANSEAAHGTLEFLLRRMRRKTDFPAMSDSVVRIQRLVTSDTESTARLAEAILKDVALTNKLLRMVNTVHFAQAAGGGVATVSRAVVLVGFAGIRNMALSVVLMEHMNDKAHAALLKDEFLRALMAGTLARELTPVVREGEDAFLGSMFQNLGRLLTEYYFPEEAVEIRQQLFSINANNNGAAREAAARKVLGLGFSDIGMGVAKAWGLPDTLQLAMTAPEGDLPSRLLMPGVQRLRWLGRAANALTDALLNDEGAAQQQALQEVAEQSAPMLGLMAKDIVATAHEACSKLASLAQAMNLQIARGSPARRLIDSHRAAPAARKVAAADTDADAAPAMESTSASGRLQAGLVEIEAAVARGDLPLNDLLNRVLETMQGVLQCRCIVFCLRDPGTGLLTGRFGLGPAASTVSAALRIDLAQARNGDLFAALCTRGADTLIADATTGPLAKKLPAWYRNTVNAPTFLLLPLLLKAAPFGLIYADMAQAGSFKVEAAELAVLKGLRDQIVLVFSRKKVD